MQKKEAIALLLAGGQGSRLGILTTTLAKPAVMYGGKYRIIDFSLSNCVNSGIDTVGVMTQYQPLKLNTHMGIGRAWDLDNINGGLTVLSPYLKSESGEWYKGTANAVYQNMHYVDKINPTYVVILSGDHIYKMDYSEMIDAHKKNKADATISVINVPMEETNRFGIMKANEDGKIYEFEEKPEKSTSTLASMGVYVFTWEVLRKYLISDNSNPESSDDFGKNIIPSMLKDNRNMYAFKFDGYWKDVGTIQSYWESNMDLVNKTPEFKLFDSDWRIYTTNHLKPANYIGPKGEIKRSIVGEGCKIYGKVFNSVIFPGVFVGEDSVIEDSIILTDSDIGNATIIKKSIIGEKATIGSNVVIGVGEDKENELFPQIYNCGITVIGEDAIVPDNAKLGKNVMIDTHVTKENYTTLNIASGMSVVKDGEKR